MPGRNLYAALLCILLCAACTPPAPAFRSTDIRGVGWGGDFELTAHTGQRLRASAFQGKVVLMFFGYTHCPDVCAPTLAKLDQVMKLLGDEARQVQVLFITVDPAHDTVTQLAEFVPRFNPSFIGLTGSDAEIAAVASDYKVAYGKSAGDTQGLMRVDHTTGILVKDRTGKPRLLVRNDFSADDLRHDVSLLLKM